MFGDGVHWMKEDGFGLGVLHRFIERYNCLAGIERPDAGGLWVG